MEVEEVGGMAVVEETRDTVAFPFLLCYYLILTLYSLSLTESWNWTWTSLVWFAAPVAFLESYEKGNGIQAKNEKTTMRW